ncbi:MAG: tetraacyldisaccharide 4'-kinase [Roseivirga sp.]|jgi:tetraacyldisaccharide 4'-kinase
MKLLRWLLFPVSILYGCLMAFRNHLYDIGKKPSLEFDRVIISVGNLSMGGTGKTPMVEYLIALLKDKYKLATLSRGYGRKTQGYRMTSETDNAATVGDEPYQYFLKFGDEIKVCVGEERALAIPSAILESEELAVFLLDDAYQHRKVVRDFNIMLSDYNHPFYQDFILPTGELREGRKGVQRADCVIITKCPKDLSDSEKGDINASVRHYGGNKTVFFSHIKYGQRLPVLKNNRVTTSSIDQVIMVTSIADNQTFKSEVERQYTILQEFVFEDHHRFTAKDLDRILEYYLSLEKSGSGVSVMTTEKDMVRLLTVKEHAVFDALDFYYIPIQFEIDRPERFQELLFKVIEEKENLH